MYGVIPAMSGKISAAGDYRLGLFYASFLFLPGALIALTLPELKDFEATPHQPET